MKFFKKIYILMYAIILCLMITLTQNYYGYQSKKPLSYLNNNKIKNINNLNTIENVYWYPAMSGLGDRLADIIGASLISSLTSKKIISIWIDAPQRSYDFNQFEMNFNKVKILPFNPSLQYDNNKRLNYVMGADLHPFLIANAFNCNSKSWDYFLKKYLEIAQSIKFNSMITKKIPKNIKNAITLHMRKSDKITNIEGTTDSTTQKEFNILITHLLNYCHHEIKKGEKIFFIASEDLNWKDKITKIIKNFGGEIMEADYSGVDPAILDLAIMANSKKIIQGTNHSMLSIIASMIKDVPLYNFSSTEFQTFSHLKLWQPLLNLNTPQKIYSKFNYNDSLGFYNYFLSSKELWPNFFKEYNGQFNCEVQ